MPRAGKSLTPEHNKRLREIVLKLLAEDFGGNQTRAAQALGVTQAYLSQFVDPTRNHGAGPKLINGLAAYTGRSLDDLYGRPALPMAAGSGYQLLSQHPEFQNRLEEALSRPRPLGVDREGVIATGTVTLSKPPEHLTVEFILRLAEALAYATPHADPET